jgi:hypothetical protein
MTTKRDRSSGQGDLLDGHGKPIAHGSPEELVAALIADVERPRESVLRRRIVSLRAEHDGPDSRFLDAYLDDDGNLNIDGQDLGPQTRPVSSDGEYEWFEVIRAAQVPALRRLLGANSDEDILDVLERSWSGERAADLERLLRESGIPIELSTWSG